MILLLMSLPLTAKDTPLGLIVYPPISGIEQSTRFASRVFDGTKWHDLSTMETVGPKQEESGIFSQGIYPGVTGNSASWSTFEMDVPVVVEVRKLSAGAIESCVIRPLSLGLKPQISSDKKSVRFDIKPRFAEKSTTHNHQAPVNIAVEFNGQSKEMMTVFASPHLYGKPKPNDPGVFKVMPGTPPPADGDWKTLYFMPGVHDFGKRAHRVKSDKQYYIPGDAWLEAGFSSGEKGTRVSNVKIFGLGVISGRKTGWADLKLHKTGDSLIGLKGPDNIVEGVSFINSPAWVMSAGSDEPKRPVILRNLKQHSWRVNCDGMYIQGNGIIEDMFLHTSDDSHYLGSGADHLSFRRIVYWHDNTSGVDVIFAASAGQRSPGNTTLEDSDSIYNDVKNGANINQRGLSKNAKIDGVAINNFRIENPTKSGPFISMKLNNDPSTFKNILLKNIVAHKDNGFPFIVSGAGPTALIENVTFEDIKVGDHYIEDFSPKNFILSFVKDLKIVRNGKVVATYSSDIEKDMKSIKSDPNNLLSNPGFEIEGYRWTGNRVGEETVPPKEGDYCIETTDGISQGLVSKFSNPITGKRYRVTAWVYIKSGEGTAVVGCETVQINLKEKKNNRQTTAIKPQSLKAGKWVELSGEIDLPIDRQTYDWFRHCNFVVKAKGSFTEYYVDQCRFERIAD